MKTLLLNSLSLLGVLGLLIPLSAHADIIPVNGITLGGAGDFTWPYHITITQDETIVSGAAPTTTPVPTNAAVGSFFTVYDFNGYIPGTCVSPAGWSCTAQAVGLTPEGVTPVAPPDNSSTVNITWSYNVGGAISGPVTIDGFAAQSTNNVITRGSFTARATRNVGEQAGTPIDNVGNVDAPMGVPEPASLGLLGLAALALSRRGRRRA